MRQSDRSSKSRLVPSGIGRRLALQLSSSSESSSSTSTARDSRHAAFNLNIACSKSDGSAKDAELKHPGFYYLLIPTLPKLALMLRYALSAEYIESVGGLPEASLAII